MKYEWLFFSDIFETEQQESNFSTRLIYKVSELFSDFRNRLGQ